MKVNNDRFIIVKLNFKDNFVLIRKYIKFDEV